MGDMSDPNYRMELGRGKFGFNDKRIDMWGLWRGKG